MDSKCFHLTEPYKGTYRSIELEHDIVSLKYPILIHKDRPKIIDKICQTTDELKYFQNSLDYLGDLS